MSVRREPARRRRLARDPRIDAGTHRAPRRTQTPPPRSAASTQLRASHRRVQEFYFATRLLRVPGPRGRHAWTREILCADTPRALFRLIDGRQHIAYASNGVEAIRIELIETGHTLLAPIADVAEVERLADLLARLDTHPRSTVR
jgi:hypothetical protein